MARRKRSLFHNAGIKLLALIMALAVYIHVFSAQDREMVLRVPLQIAPIPGDLALTGEVPAVARIRVRASGKDLLKLRTRRFPLRVALESPRVGALQRPLFGSDVVLPHGVKAARIEVLEPDLLHLQIEKSRTRQLPIAVRLEGELPSDRAMVRRPVPEPAAVRATGPESILAALDSLHTAPLSVEGWRGDTEKDVRLAPPSGISVEPGSIRLLIEIEEREERMVGPLGIRIDAIASARAASIDPESVMVFLSGAVSVVKQVDPHALDVVARVRRPVPHAQKVPLAAALSRQASPVLMRIRCRPDSAVVVLQR